jgi:hypothetical protein
MILHHEPSWNTEDLETSSRIKTRTKKEDMTILVCDSRMQVDEAMTILGPERAVALHSAGSPDHLSRTLIKLPA